MTDYRNSSDPLYRDPNDPMNRDIGYEPAARGSGTAWGWIAGAVFLVIILAIALGVGREPSRVATNDTAAPAATRMAPPSNAVHPASPAAPGLAPPPAPAPAPNRP